MSGDGLTDLYDATRADFSDEECRALTPILNGLKEPFSERYEVFGEIGSGAEKRVMQAYDRSLDRQVALAYPVRGDDDEEIERFLREARLTANLVHPNIMPVHHIGLDGQGAPFFTMEHLSGDSLMDIIVGLKRGDSEYLSKYPLNVLLGIYLKVCDAMAYAHSREVLHLDLKPSNIRVGPFGDVYVCDWGLARVCHAGDESVEELPLGELDGDKLNEHTLTGTLKGTLGFMAPEQAAGLREKTAQTDVYALGAILYMMLVFDPPVDEASNLEAIEMTKRGGIIPPRDRSKGALIPPSVEAVAMTALSLSPDDRYPSVAVLQADLSLYLQGFPATAENAGRGRRLVLWAQRHGQSVLLALVSLTVLSVIAGIGVLRVNAARGAAVQAKLEAVENLKLYRSEREVSQHLSDEVIQMLEYLAMRPDMRHPRLNIKLIDQKLSDALDPSLRLSLLEKKGVLHFILQEFVAASACFEQSGVGYSEHLLPVSQAYASMKPKDESLLSDSEVALLFTSRQPVYKQFSYYLYHHHMRRRQNRSEGGYQALAGTLLREMNGPRPKQVFELEVEPSAGGYKLDLSGMAISRLKMMIPGVLYANILEPYEFAELDISGTLIADLIEIEDLQVKCLKMVGLEQLKTARGLCLRLENMGVERLIVEKGRFKGKLLERLKEQVELIEL